MKVQIEVTGDRQHGAVYDVLSERARQDAKWGRIERHCREVSPEQWVTILVEEVGELAEAILEREPAETYDEAVQVGAVAISILEAMLVDLEEAGVEDTPWEARSE